MKRRGFLHTATTGASLWAASAIGRGAASEATRQNVAMSKTQSNSRVETHDGTPLFCRTWGSGRPVIFVHGWAVTCDVWQYAMATLSSGALCVAYDKRGHGRSGDPGRGYNYDALADDLAAVLEQLDLRNAVLVGHSMGPAEIARYVTRHAAARVSRLVLISSALPFMMKAPDNPDGIDPSVFAARRQQWLQDMPKFLADNARSFVGSEASAETVAWVAQMGAQASLKALIELNHAITETDLRADLTQIKLPTLVIHGAQDKSAPLELSGKRTAAMIQGSQLKIYEDAPHGLLLTHQERLTSDLLQWINA